MNDLPFEILVHVLSQLPPQDRLNGALTCKRWARAVSTPQLLSDINLCIWGSKMKAAEEVVMRSHRDYLNLRLREGVLESYNPEFWTKVGRSLRELEFLRCRWQPEVLFNILGACTRLESLKISDSGDVEINPQEVKRNPHPKDFHLSENACLRKMQEALRNVRHLELDLNRARNISAQLLEVMPKVMSLSLSGFNHGDYLVDRLSKSSGTGRAITELDLSQAHLTARSHLKLFSLCSATLQVLKFDTYFPHKAFDAIGKCSQLHVLSIRAHDDFDDNHMRKILLSNPGLGDLRIDGCKSLTDAALAPMHELKKLRRVNLSLCDGYITNDFLLSLGRISSLQFLDIASKLNSRHENCATVLQSIASLPYLQTFRVDNEHFNSECYEVIFEKFKELIALELYCWQEVAETDVMKLCRFKNLKHLSAYQGRGFTDLAVSRGVGSPDMESLRLIGCPLTDDGLASVGAHHTRLRHLSVTRCKNVTETGLLTLLQSEPLLEKLHVADVPVTGDFFETVDSHCPRLRSLLVSVDPSMNQSVVESFKARRPIMQVGIYRKTM